MGNSRNDRACPAKFAACGVLGAEVGKVYQTLSPRRFAAFVEGSSEGGSEGDRARWTGSKMVQTGYEMSSGKNE